MTRPTAALAAAAIQRPHDGEPIDARVLSEACARAWKLLAVALRGRALQRRLARTTDPAVRAVVSGFLDVFARDDDEAVAALRAAPLDDADIDPRRTDGDLEAALAGYPALRPYAALAITLARELVRLAAPGSAWVWPAAPAAEAMAIAGIAPMLDSPELDALLAVPPGADPATVDQLGTLRLELSALQSQRDRELADVEGVRAETAAMTQRLADLRDELRDRAALADDRARAAGVLREELDGMKAELAQVRRELARTRFVTMFAERLAPIEDAGRRRAYVDLLEAYAHASPLTDRVELGPSLARALDAHDARLRGVRLTRRLDDELAVHGAHRELQLVWSELIANAADALAGAGTLTVFTARTGAWLAVSFLDDGPGLPPAIQAALFAPFITSRPPSRNLGIGLYLARCFIERHAGRIELESAPGRTRVTVALPLS